MVRTTMLVAGAAALASTSAFVTPGAMPAAAVSRSVTVMRAEGGSVGGNPFKSGAAAIFDIFTANPANRNKGSSGDGGMMGGNNGGDDVNFNMGSFSEDDENNDFITAMAAMGVLGELWKNYNDVLTTNPILTKACTSLVGFSIGDTLAQKFVSKGDDFDYKRLARMAAFGFLFHGTISHFFYNKLDSVIPGKTPLDIVKKVFTDQVLWAPIFTFIYLTWMGVTDGMSPAAVGEKIKNDLVKGVVGSWSVWPIVHAIGFKYVPLEQRLLYINCIQIGYNMFLSVLGSSGKTQTAADEAAAQVKSATKSAREQAKRSL